MYGFIRIMQSNMQFCEETIHLDNPRHPGLLALFNEPVA